jgi:hypothetical protein
MKFRQVTWYSKLLALALFVALPFVGFYVGMKYQQAVAPPKEVKVGTPSAVPKVGNKSTTNITIKTDKLTLKTTYENGFLKYSGAVQLPTPCHQLKDQSGVMESYPEQVRIQLVVEPPPSGTVCTQVITEKEFSGQVKVSEKATISVYLNGKKVD